MAGISFFGAKGGGGGGGGIRKVLDAPARLALLPTAGDFVVQLDTNDLWYYNGTAWELFVEDLDNNDIDQLQLDLAAHLSDTSDAHDASAISFVAGGTIAATDVQAAITEVAGDAATALANHVAAGDPHPQYATDTDLTNHLNDTVDAHDASAISFNPAGSISATDVQAAIQELDTEVDARLDTLEAASHPAATIGSFGSSPNSNGLSISGQAISLQPANASNPGALTTNTQDISGEKRFSNGLFVGAHSALPTTMLFVLSSVTQGSRPYPRMTTTQRNTLGGLTGSSPTLEDGMLVHDQTLRVPFFFDSLVGWQPVGFSSVSSPLGVSGTFNTGGFRNRIYPVSGSAGAHGVITSFSNISPQDGDQFTLIGESDTATVEINSATTGCVLNGTCILGLNDSITFVFYSGSWREIARRD